jgi:anti-anti-sigma regulatory factor
MKKIFYIEMEWDLDTISIKEYNKNIEEIIKWIENPSILLLDFKKVTYINSTAIWHISDWYNKLEELASEIIILWINDLILDTINLVWLGERLQFFESLDKFKIEYKNN